MKMTPSLRIVTAFLGALFVCATAHAFQDDYVWQERFKKQIALAEKGSSDAQYDVGEMYEKGSGVATDDKKAFSWYEKSAAQGHLKAQFKVAYMYYKGQGVGANISKAAKLMENPANEGNVRAQYYYGQMFEKGDGVKQDYDEAFEWYSRSSLGGFKPADDSLSSLKKVIAEKARRDEENAVKNIAKAPKSSSPAAKTPAKVDAAKLESSQVATVEGIQPALQTVPTTAGALLNGTWLSLAKLPAEYMPSKITSCHKTSESVIECMSEDLQRKIAGTEIVYQTKAIIYAMRKDGNFKIAYRNNVTKIMNVKEGEKEGEEQPSGSGDTASIKLGWQETEHRLECKIDSNQTVNCVKNKTQKITLKNQTMS